MAAADGTLKESQTIELGPALSVCVVMASGGYPGVYQKGKPISGLDEVGKLKDVMVFHAGTAMSEGQVVTGAAAESSASPRWAKQSPRPASGPTKPSPGSTSTARSSAEISGTGRSSRTTTPFWPRISV